MKTGQLYKKDQSAYELNEGLYGITQYQDAEEREQLSVLEKFCMNSGPIDKNVNDKGIRVNNPDILQFTPGFNTLTFNINGALGTACNGRTREFQSLPSMGITNTARQKEYTIYTTSLETSTVQTYAYAGEFYQGPVEPNFGMGFTMTYDQDVEDSFEFFDELTINIPAMTCLVPEGYRSSSTTSDKMYGAVNIKGSSFTLPSNYASYNRRAGRNLIFYKSTVSNSMARPLISGQAGISFTDNGSGLYFCSEEELLIVDDYTTLPPFYCENTYGSTTLPPFYCENTYGSTDLIPSSPRFIFSRKHNMFLMRANWIIQIGEAGKIWKMAYYQALGLALIGEFNISGSSITNVSFYPAKGPNPVWIDTSTCKPKFKVFKNGNWDTQQALIPVGKVYMASSSINALIEKVETFDYNHSRIEKNRFPTFEVNEAHRNNNGEFNFIQSNIVYRNIDINDEGKATISYPINSDYKVSGDTLPQINPYIPFNPQPHQSWFVELEFSIGALPATGQSITLFHNGVIDVTNSDKMQLGCGLLIWKTGGVFQMALSSNGSDWDILDTLSTSGFSLTANSSYHFIFYFNGTSYNLIGYNLSQTPTYSNLYTFESSTPIYTVSQSTLNNWINTYGRSGTVIGAIDINQGTDTSTSVTYNLSKCSFGIYKEPPTTISQASNPSNMIKQWDGSKFNEVTAVAPFTYTDARGNTFTQYDNITVKRNSMKGEQNFVMENRQLKPVGNIYRQAKEPNFVTDNNPTKDISKSQCILKMPTIPATWQGNTLTLNPGWEVICPMGKDPVTNENLFEIKRFDDKPLSSTNAVANVTKGLVCISLVWDDYLWISNYTFTTTYPNSACLYFNENQNIFQRYVNYLLPGEFTVPIGTFTSDALKNITSFTPFKPQNGYPLWFDTVSQRSYSYEPEIQPYNVSIKEETSSI